MKVRACHNHIEVLDYKRGQRYQLEKRFQTWNASYRRYEDNHIYYEDNTLFLPRGINLRVFYDDDVEMVFEPNPYDKVDMISYGTPKDEEQEHVIDFLTGENGFTNSRVSSQIVLTAPPGFGKTFCAVKAMCYYKMRTLIINHRKKILEQWIEEILNNTSIKADEILYAGADEIRYIADNKINSNIKVIIASHQTFTAVANSDGWKTVSNFLKNSRIGLKIVDEAHRHVRNSFLIDVHASIKKNMYLTATFNRSDNREDKIFQDAFSNTPKYGDHLIEITRKHIIYILINFNSRPSYEEILSLKGYNGGFDKNKYIDYQMKKGYLKDGIIKFYNRFIKDNEGRTLILSSKIRSSEYFADILSNEFQDKKVSVYNSTIDHKEKERAMEESDIISATPSSLGEGTNMKKLRFLFMLEPYASKVNAFQNPSRLREYDKEKYTFYIEFIDEGFKEVMEWANRRRQKFKHYFHSQRNVKLDEL